MGWDVSIADKGFALHVADLCSIPSTQFSALLGPAGVIPEHEAKSKPRVPLGGAPWTPTPIFSMKRTRKDCLLLWCLNLDT